MRDAEGTAPRSLTLDDRLLLPRSPLPTPARTSTPAYPPLSGVDILTTNARPGPRANALYRLMKLR